MGDRQPAAPAGPELAGVSMSFGKMNEFIELLRTVTRTDTEGFGVTEEEVLASVRAYREPRNASQRWVNRAAFSDATDLFRFRTIPGVAVTTSMVIVCAGGRYDIVSVEDVRGRGMYIEVLAKKVTASDGTR
uniref:Putative head tail adaptor n=1 Tax=Siphoviridae sp. ctur44 TaxID=2825717 RepID=A0A8S5P442_9CAUD|nr:MAG TPA: putative head tail adaptor [Siphoviridae sp. ctur44]